MQYLLDREGRVAAEFPDGSFNSNMIEVVTSEQLRDGARLLWYYLAQAVLLGPCGIVAWMLWSRRDAGRSDPYGADFPAGPVALGARGAIYRRGGWGCAPGDNVEHLTTSIDYNDRRPTWWTQRPKDCWTEDGAPKMVFVADVIDRTQDASLVCGLLPRYGWEPNGYRPVWWLPERLEAGSKVALAVVEGMHMNAASVRPLADVYIPGASA